MTYHLYDTVTYAIRQNGGEVAGFIAVLPTNEQVQDGLCIITAEQALHSGIGIMQPPLDSTHYDSLSMNEITRSQFHLPDIDPKQPIMIGYIRTVYADKHYHDTVQVLFACMPHAAVDAAGFKNETVYRLVGGELQEPTPVPIGYTIAQLTNYVLKLPGDVVAYSGNPMTHDDTMREIYCTIIDSNYTMTKDERNALYSSYFPKERFYCTAIHDDDFLRYVEEHILN